MTNNLTAEAVARAMGWEFLQCDEYRDGTNLAYRKYKDMTWLHARLPELDSDEMQCAMMDFMDSKANGWNIACRWHTDEENQTYKSWHAEWCVGSDGEPVYCVVDTKRHLALAAAVMAVAGKDT